MINALLHMFVFIGLLVFISAFILHLLGSIGDVQIPGKILRKLLKKPAKKIEFNDKEVFFMRMFNLVFLSHSIIFIIFFYWFYLKYVR